MVDSARRLEASARHPTHIEKIHPALPERVYLLSPGDVHLAAKNRVKALHEILSKTACDLLVLNGDFLDTAELKSLLQNLEKKDREFIRLIEQKRLSGMRVVYISGNHDEDMPALLREVAVMRENGAFREGSEPHDVLEALSLIGNWQLQKSFVHDYQGKRLAHIHGDQWDHIVHGQYLWFLADIGSFLWELLKRADGERHRIAIFMKRRVKLWMKISGNVAQGAMAFAREHSAHYVFAGHTHDPHESSDGEVKYVNAGSFDMYEAGLVSVDTEGAVTLHRVYARTKPISATKEKGV